jgi:hypothetical protein
VLSRLFRRRFLEELELAHRTNQLQFFGEYAQLSDVSTFAKWFTFRKYSTLHDHLLRTRI